MSAAAANRNSIVKRINYWRRIFSAYLTTNPSQLTFWHERPTMNARLRVDAIGEYYMPFDAKANYPGPKDERGVPLLDYRGSLGQQYNPIAIAQYGLGNFNLWSQTGRDSRKVEFLRVADWLADNLQRNSAGIPVWNHHFDWDYRTSLKAPWYSGLAQGQGISMLVRAWTATGASKYLEASRNAMEAFYADVSDGGVVFTDSERNLWIEEYIVHPDPPTHILNGFMWASWGIYDYSLVTKDRAAKQLFESFVRTIGSNLPRFDTGYWSLYEQSGTKMKMIASHFYHQLHIAQLHVMYRLTGDPVFREFSEKWELYARSAWNRRRALVQKSIFKLIYY
jgi:heparosan-N-sulfate-glucuronate 5-epimerase